MSLPDARDPSLQDNVSLAPALPFNSLHVGAHLDRRARSQLTAPQAVRRAVWGTAEECGDARLERCRTFMPVPDP